MAKLTATHNGWEGEIAVPSEEDAQALLRYQVALISLAYEYVSLRGGHQGEFPEIGDAEYTARKLILDDLCDQFEALFTQKLSTVSWEEG